MAKSIEILCCAEEVDGKIRKKGEGPLAFRSNIGIPADQAQALINELL